LKIGLALPREIESTQEEMAVEAPGQNSLSRIQWACVPRKRG